VPSLSAFPDSYANSRDTFRQLAHQHAQWARSIVVGLDTQPAVNLPSPPWSPLDNADDAPLTIDVAYLGPNRPQRIVLVTSGLHGVEGLFGAAVQHRLFETYDAYRNSPVGMLLVHALNPHGFALRRRWNEANIDLNRNFLLPGEAYAGAPPHYAKLNGLLNPAHGPRRVDPFMLLALAKLGRFGLAALQQAIAGGQYEYPRGLFFGGQQPSTTQCLLQAHLSDWLQGAEEIIHLDFHTGLGPWATHKLLVETPADASGTRWLTTIYGEDLVVSHDSGQAAYVTRGGLGTWCEHYLANRKYAYACAEFGTYPPLKVLAGLRKENQAYWYTKPNSPERLAAGDRLQELFCPASTTWREKVVSDCVALVERALNAWT